MEHSAAQELGEGTREVLRLYQKAKKAADGCSDLVLPELIVAAKQSAGKSSLLTHLLAGSVTFPSGTGTCTKCPAVVFSKNTDGPRKCKFKKRFHYDDAKGVDLEESVILKCDQAPITESEWSSITSRIAELQVEMLKGPEGNLNLSFTHNEIVVELEGSGLPDLTIKDLPGLVSAKDKETCKAVESITERAMSKPNAIIIACVTCDDDLDNQSILTLARKHDVEGRRTIGVLTKPDRIQEGEHEVMLQILNNSHPDATLQYGWFAVRCRTATEKDVDDSRACEAEVSFFAQNEIGKKMKLEQPDRCGVDKLRERASLIEVALTQDQVPQLRAGIQKSLTKNEEKLRELSQSCSVTEETVTEYLFDLVSGLHRKVREVIICSGHADRSLWQRVRDKFMEAREQLRDTTPEYQHDQQQQARMATVWTLEKVMKLFRDGQGRELLEHNNIDLAAKTIIYGSLENWHQPTEKCVQDVKRELDVFCADLVSKDKRIQPKLAAEIKASMKQLIAENYHSCQKECEKNLRRHGCNRGLLSIDRAQIEPLMEKRLAELRKSLGPADLQQPSTARAPPADHAASLPPAVSLQVPAPPGRGHGELPNRADALRLLTAAARPAGRWSGVIAVVAGGAAVGCRLVKASKKKGGSRLLNAAGAVAGAVVAAAGAGVVEWAHRLYFAGSAPRQQDPESGASVDYQAEVPGPEGAEPEAAEADNGGRDARPAAALARPRQPEESQDVSDVLKTMALALAYFDRAVEQYADSLQATVNDTLLGSFKDHLERQLRSDLKLRTAKPQELLLLVTDVVSERKRQSLCDKVTDQKEALRSIEEYMGKSMRGALPPLEGSNGFCIVDH